MKSIFASAPAFLLEGANFRVPRRKIEAGSEERETKRLRLAFDQAAGQIEALRARVSAATPEVDGVLEAHLAIVRDPALLGQAEKLLRAERWTPEWALSSVLEDHSRALLSTGDEYLAHRVSDLRDIQHRILRVLLAQREEDLARTEGTVVIVAQDLTPSQTAALDRTKVVGVVTEAGGATSHTAIIARIADTPEKRSKGMMFRSALGQRQGMLFVFPKEEHQSFWMKNTPVSLDMIFVSARNEIVTIHEKTTPYSPQSYTSTKPAQFVVEVNAGFARSQGISVGDKVRWQRREGG